MFARLLVAFQSRLLAQLPETQQANFLDGALQLTKLSLHLMTSQDDDDPCFADAFDQTLMAWTTIAEAGVSCWFESCIAVSNLPCRQPKTRSLRLGLKSWGQYLKLTSKVGFKRLSVTVWTQAR
jgi:hypothetical protein